jgi:plastocyanin
VIVKTVEVSATSYKFEPAEVTVGLGDTVRFVQTSAMPHNVEFTKTPKGSKLGATKMGPYLAAPNQTYDVVIDTRFTSGQYKYICTPHVSMGMKGTISVGTLQ